MALQRLQPEDVMVSEAELIRAKRRHRRVLWLLLLSLLSNFVQWNSISSLNEQLASEKHQVLMLIGTIDEIKETKP